MSTIKLFESKPIRSVWDEKKEKWYFSIVDVVDFDLDTKNLNYPPVAEEILIQYLNRKENAQETLIGKQKTYGDNAPFTILQFYPNHFESG